MPDSEVCQVCRQSREWHNHHAPRHRFVGPNDSLENWGIEEPPTPPIVAARGGDMILRLALVKAGVISELDLTAAQVWMQEAQNHGMAVVVEAGEYKLVPVEEMLARLVKT